MPLYTLVSNALSKFENVSLESYGTSKKTAEVFVPPRPHKTN